MKQHQGALGRLAVLKVLAQRFAFLSLVFAAFALMLLGKADTFVVERLRVVIDDVVAPVLGVLSRPVAAIGDVATGVHDLAALRAENVRLRDENARLLHWETLARQLDSENRALRGQLNYVPDPDPSFITARVVGDTANAFYNSMLVNAGTKDGVRKGQAVLSGESLVGRVTDLGQHQARFLLLTDLNSNIPVLVGVARTQAILAGDNSERPILDYRAPNSVVNPGDRVITSGHGGVFPPGLPIGVVASVQDGTVHVELYVHRYQLEYVTLVEYGLPGILPADSSSDEPDR